MNQNPQLALFSYTNPLRLKIWTEWFKQIPDQPGVYFMKDADENVIYVGKAGSLRNRLS